MHGAADRRQVVLAEGLERDVAQDDDVIVAADLLEGPLQDGDRVLAVAFEPLRIGSRHPSRRAGEPLPVRVLARPADEGANRLLRRLPARATPEPRFDLKLRERPVHRCLHAAGSARWIEVAGESSRTGRAQRFQGLPPARTDSNGR